MVGRKNEKGEQTSPGGTPGAQDSCKQLRVEGEAVEALGCILDEFPDVNVNGHNAH